MRSLCGERRRQFQLRAINRGPAARHWASVMSIVGSRALGMTGRYAPRLAANSRRNFSVLAIQHAEWSSIQASASASDAKPMTVSDGSPGHEIRTDQPRSPESFWGAAIACDVAATETGPKPNAPGASVAGASQVASAISQLMTLRMASHGFRARVSWE